MSGKPIDEAVVHAFVDWLAKEMPPGTYISSPQWWASRIIRQVEHLTAARQQGQAVALPKLKQTDPSHSRAEMQWVFGYNAALADVMCLNRHTAPPSAPVGVDELAKSWEKAALVDVLTEGERAVLRNCTRALRALAQQQEPKS